MWHVSIARLNRKGAVPLRRWTIPISAAAWRTAAGYLQGVGQGVAIEHRGEVALHLRKGLTEAEIGALSKEWLAIPAQDAFVPEAGIETRL